MYLETEFVSLTLYKQRQAELAREAANERLADISRQETRRERAMNKQRAENEKPQR